MIKFTDLTENKKADILCIQFSEHSRSSLTKIKTYFKESNTIDNSIVLANEIEKQKLQETILKDTRYELDSKTETIYLKPYFAYLSETAQDTVNLMGNKIKIIKEDIGESFKLLIESMSEKKSLPYLFKMKFERDLLASLIEQKVYN